MSNLCGVLAMQGDYAKHREALSRCGVATIEVRRPQELERCERLVIPGGESTTMYRLLQKADLWQPLLKRAQAGMPMLGTCAGMILLSRHIAALSDGVGPAHSAGRRLADHTRNFGEQPCLAAIDLQVRRNAYGRQIASFSAELDLLRQRPQATAFADFVRQRGQNGTALPLIFIRAPQAVSWGPGVRVLLRYEAQAICLQQDKVVVASFHPELTDSTLLHEYFLSL